MLHFGLEAALLNLVVSVDISFKMLNECRVHLARLSAHEVPHEFGGRITCEVGFDIPPVVTRFVTDAIQCEATGYFRHDPVADLCLGKSWINLDQSKKRKLRHDGPAIGRWKQAPLKCTWIQPH